MASKKVVVTIVGKDETGKATKSAEKNFTSLGNVARTVGPLVTAAFGAAVIRESVKAFIRQEAAIAQLEQRLKSTGGVAGFTSEQLQRMASSLQDVTTFGDEATIEMQALLLTFTQIQGPIFERAQESILNVATAMGTDLKSAAIQVGKALNDPKGQLSALSRSGIQFTEVQKDMIKTMQESGDVAGAQAVILKELETQFGGAARAARETFGGALIAAGNSIGDLSEKFAEAIIESTGFKQVLQDIPGIINRIDRAINGIDAEGRLIEIDDELNAIKNDVIQIDNLLQFDQAALESRTQPLLDKMQALREEAALLREEIGTPTTPVVVPVEPTASSIAAGIGEAGPATAVAEQASMLALMEEQENDAFLLREARRMAELDNFRLIQEGMEDATLTRLTNERQAGLDTEEALRASRQTTANLSVNLLSFLGQKNRVFALAALALQKGLDISKIISASAVAQTTALALPPGLAAAKIAQIKAFTAVNIALVAGLGLAQAAGGAGGGGGGGGGGVGGGAAPIAQPQPTAAEPVGGTTIIFEGDFFGDEQLIEDKIIPAINAATNRGVTLLVRGT